MGYSLDKILIVDFYKAIDDNNPKAIGFNLSTPLFEELVGEYLEKQKGTLDINDRKIKNIEDKLIIVAACLLYLETNLMDSEIMEVLNSMKFVITKDNYPFDLIEINKKIEGLKRKLDLLKSGNTKELGKKKNAKKDKVSIYEILATMSANLEGVYLDPRKVVVSEFLSYQKVISSKQESYEKIKNKNKLNGSKR